LAGVVATLGRSFGNWRGVHGIHANHPRQS
jgi:hypothetical protein